MKLPATLKGSATKVEHNSKSAGLGSLITALLVALNVDITVATPAGALGAALLYMFMPYRKPSA